MTQAQLAAAAGVPLSSLQNWEIDRREPGFRAACSLAQALGVAAETLADTAPVEEAGKAPRPAGPTVRSQAKPGRPGKLPEASPQKKPRSRGKGK